jgi:hypothetical protein
MSEEPMSPSARVSGINKAAALFVLILAFCVASNAQSYQQGKILKWDTEAYGRHGNVTRNAAVYYVQVGSVIYQVTRGTTRPEANLVSGQKVQCRIEKDHMFIPGEKGKEVNLSVIGSAEAASE